MKWRSTLESEVFDGFDFAFDFSLGGRHVQIPVFALFRAVHWSETDWYPVLLIC